MFTVLCVLAFSIIVMRQGFKLFMAAVLVLMDMDSDK